MRFSPFRQWIRKLVGTQEPRQGSRRIQRTIVRLEQLDDRLTPSAVSWTGAGDGTSWNDASNWSDSLVPGSGDDVTINSGTINFSGTDTVNSLTILGGTLNTSGSLSTNQGLTLSNTFATIDNTGTLTVGGAFDWTDGTLNGTGTTVLDGTANLSGGFFSMLTNQQVQNNGTVTIADGNSIDFSGNAVWNNETGSTLDLEGSGSLGTFFTTSSAAFNNFGTVETSSPTGTASIGVAFNNSGTVDVQSGTFNLSGGGTGGSTFTIDAGAVLSTGNYSFQNATVTGDGVVTVSTFDTLTVAAASSIENLTVNGGALTVNDSLSVQNLTVSGGTVTTNAPLEASNLTLSGGTITGASTITIDDNFTWTGGTLGGTGTTILNGTSSLSGGFFSDLNNEQIENNGYATIGNGNSIDFEGNAVWNNEAGSTLELQGSGSLNTFFASSSAAFNNLGTVETSTPPGTGTIAVAFNNSGTVDVQTGTLNLSDGGTGGGTFTIDAGAILSGSNYTLLNAAVTGPGTLQISSLTIAGTTTIQNQDVTGGTVTNNTTLDVQDLTISGGTVTNNDSLEVQDLILSGGTLTGPGTTTVDDKFTWTGGTLSGTGVMILNGTSSLSGGFFSMLTNQQIDNNGTATITSGNSIDFNGSAVWNNEVGSTLNLEGSGSLGTFFTTLSAAFNNFGTVETSSPVGTASIGVAFNNSGTVDVQTGTLNLSDGGSGGGSFTIAAGATLSGSNYTLESATVTGPGTFQISNLTVSGTTNIQNQHVASGTVTNNAILDVQDLTISGGTVTNDDSLEVQNLTMSGGTLTNNGTLTVQNLTLDNTFATIANPGTLTVNGTFTWADGTLSGTGTTILNGASSLSGGFFSDLDNQQIQNNGDTIITNGNSIDFEGGAVWNNEAGSTLELQGSGSLSTFFANSSAAFNNFGTVETSTPPGTAKIGVAFNNSGTVDVQTGTLNLSDGGTGGGSFTIAAGATLSGSNYTLESATITGPGTLQINNLTVSGTTNIQNQDVTGGTVTNNATLDVQDLIISGGTVTNNGSLDVQDLTLNGGNLTNNGSLDVQDLTLSNGTLTNNGPLEVQDLTLSGGTLTGPGTITVDENLTWTSGTLSGTGVTILNGTSSLSGNLDNEQIKNYGTATIPNGSSIDFQGSAVWNNETGSTLNLVGSGSISSFFASSSAAFNNFGTFQTSATAGTTTISVAFNNSGTVNVQSGNLNLTGGGTGSGTFNLGTGTVLSSGNYTLQNATVSGGGVITVSTFDTLTIVGASSVQNLTVNGGTVTVNDSVSMQNLTVSNGTLTNNATLTVQNLTLDGTFATIANPGTLTVNGTFNWTGGTLSGTGTTILNGTSSLSGGFFSKLDNQQIDNNGSATITNGNSIDLEGGAVWNNEAGSTLELQGSGSLNTFFASPSAAFNNLGTVETSTPPGTATIAVAFNNSGTVDVQTGTLNLSDGGIGGGSFTIAGGATLSASKYTLQNATVTGPGRLQITTLTVSGTTNIQNQDVTGGTVTNNATLDVQDLTISGGTVTNNDSLEVQDLTLSGGTLTNYGTLTVQNLTLDNTFAAIANPGTLTVNGTFTWTNGTLSGTGTTILNGTSSLSGGTLDNEQVENNATATITGGNSITFEGNAVWNNESGSTFVMDGSIGNFLEGAGFGFFNYGTVEINLPGETATIAVPFNNSGTVDVQAGTLDLSGGGTGGNTFTIESGAVWSIGKYTLQDATVTGDGTVQVGSFSTLTVLGDTTIQNLTVDSGTVNNSNSLEVQNLTLEESPFSTISNAGTLTIDTQFVWNEGELEGTGTTILNGDSGLSGGFFSMLDNQQVDNYGTATVSAGNSIELNGNTVWNNEVGGTLLLQGGGSLDDFFASSSAAVNNAGLIEVEAPGGTSEIGIPVSNTGTIEIDTGSLTLGGAFSNAGTVSVSAGATLFIAFNFTQTAGTTDVDGTLQTNSVVIDGGSLFGAGIIRANVTNSGQVTAGDGPGILNISGNYTQTSAGSLNIEIDSTTPGSGYGQLAVFGTASLAGSLNLIDPTNFLPDGGDTFEVLKFASSTGNFDTYNGLNLENGAILQPEFTSNDNGLDLVTYITTTTTVTSNQVNNNSLYGQDTTFTATVTAADGSIPQGTAQFQLNGMDVGPVTLVNGTATFDAGILPAGTYQVTVIYGGSGFNLSDTSAPITYTVNQDPTTTTLINSPAITAVGQSVTFTATVTANPPGGGTPTGSVSFYDGSTLLDTVGLPAGGPDQVSFTTSALAVGDHTITAVYSGDSNFITSTSTAATEIILGPGVYVFGSSLYVVGADTSDSVQIDPVGSSNTGSTGLQVNSMLDKVSSTQPFSQPFNAIYIFGDNGNDTIHMASTLTVDSFITEGNGNDYVQTAGGNDVITLGSGNDQVFSGNGNKTITAGNGNDAVTAGNGNNTIALGDGNDTVQLGNGNNTASLGNGADSLSAGCGNNTITLGNHNGDTVEVGGGNNVIVTGNGNGDSISAGDGDNLVAAGTGQHTVTLGNGSNILIDGSVSLTQAGDSLNQVLNDWIANGDTVANVSDIRSRLDVTYNSSHANDLTAGSGLDWFFFTYVGDQTNMKPTDLQN